MDSSRSRLGSRLALGLRRWARASDESGAAAVEFALLLPVLALLLFGIIKLGIVFNNYVQLTNAAAAGQRQLSISRGSSTPYSGTVSAIQAAAPNLNLSASQLKTRAVLTVNGTTCTDDQAACQSAFGTGVASPPLQATVSLTYPCDMAIFTAILPTCRLAASSSGAVQ